MRKTNWKDKDDVILTCKELNKIARKGYESLVMQYKGRCDYNITHVSRPDRWDRNDVTVVWRP